MVLNYKAEGIVKDDVVITANGRSEPKIHPVDGCLLEKS